MSPLTRTAALGCALALALAAGALADDGQPLSPARLRRLAAAGWYPSSVVLELRSGGTQAARRITGTAGDDLTGARPLRAGQAAAAGPIAGWLPGAAPSGRAVADELGKNVQKVEGAIREQHGLAIELDRAGSDYVSMVTGKHPRDLLRPLLLFLVEKRVIAADEVEPMLATNEPAELLARLRERIHRARETRAGLEVQRYFLIERLEKAVAETARR